MPMGYSRKNPKRRREGWGHEISRAIEQRAYGNSAHGQCKNSQVMSETSVSNMITLDQNVFKTLDMLDC